MNNLRILVYSASIFLSGFLQGQHKLVPGDGILDPEIYGSGRKNAIYGEVGGSGFLLSVNYERKLVEQEKLSLNARVGIGSAIFVSAIPTGGLNMCLGSKSSKLEIGFNAIRTYAFDLFLAGNSTFVLANPIIGYRYANDQGFLFRFTVTPFFELIDPDDWIDDGFAFPWAGVSMGYCF
jgi:hypothetical protein